MKKFSLKYFYVVILIFLSINGIFSGSAGFDPDPFPDPNTLIIENEALQWWSGYNTNDHLIASARSSGSALAGYSFMFFHYQHEDDPIKWTLTKAILGIPFYLPIYSKDFITQELHEMTITVEGAGFTTRSMHIVENGVYYESRFIGDFFAIDGGLVDGKQLIGGGNIDISPRTSGNAKITLHIEGKSQFQYKWTIFFGLFTLYRSAVKTMYFDLSYSAECSAYQTN